MLQHPPLLYIFPPVFISPLFQRNDIIRIMDPGVFLNDNDLNAYFHLLAVRSTSQTWLPTVWYADNIAANDPDVVSCSFF
jgi:hypothetical protein